MFPSTFLGKQNGLFPLGQVLKYILVYTTKVNSTFLKCWLVNLEAITKHAKTKNRMQIIGTLRESDNISVFWEK